MGRVEVLAEKRVVRQFQALLKACGLYLDAGGRHRILACLVLANTTLAFLDMSYSMYLYFRDTGRLATLAHHSALLVDVFAGITIYVLKRPQVLRMVGEMTRSHDYESQLMAEYTAETQRLRARRMDRMRKVFLFWISYMFLNIVLNSYLEKQLTDAEFMLLYQSWFPFNLDRIHFHLIAYLWQSLIVMTICLLVNGVVAFNYLVYMHFTSEFQLLTHALETSQARALELEAAGVPAKQAFLRSIDHCARHHSEIARYFLDSKDFYRYIYLTAFTTGLVVCVCLGLVFVSDNIATQIKFTGVSIVQMFILFTLCWFSEKISEESEKIRFVIYGTNWYEMPKACQSTLRLMAESTFRPMTLVSASGHEANLDTFMSMIKASYSYFNMLAATRS